MGWRVSNGTLTSFARRPFDRMRPFGPKNGDSGGEATLGLHVGVGCKQIAFRSKAFALRQQKQLILGSLSSSADSARDSTRDRLPGGRRRRLYATMRLNLRNELKRSHKTNGELTKELCQQRLERPEGQLRSALESATAQSYRETPAPLAKRCLSTAPG